MLFSKPQLEQLVRNGQPDETGKDHYPVVKLFIRDTGMVWLITEIDPLNPAKAFGLYDLGAGSPNIGTFDLLELTGYRVNGQGIERDPYFAGKYPLSVYAQVARSIGYITEVEALLSKWKPPKLLP